MLGNGNFGWTEKLDHVLRRLAKNVKVVRKNVWQRALTPALYQYLIYYNANTSSGGLGVNVCHMVKYEARARPLIKACDDTGS